MFYNSILTSYFFLRALQVILVCPDLPAKKALQGHKVQLAWPGLPGHLARKDSKAIADCLELLAFREARASSVQSVQLVRQEKKVPWVIMVKLDRKATREERAQLVQLVD